MKEVFIVSAARTPIGAFQGKLKDVPAPRLGATAIAAAVERAGIAPESIEECLMGAVLTAGVGQAPARQAALFAGLPQAVRATTVNRVCGSGLKAVMLASQMITSNDADTVVAGGMESMSRAPFLVPGARDGLRFGHTQLLDSILWDGLTDAYNEKPMGNCAELCAAERRFSRQEQDRYATQSYRRALGAIQAGLFKTETAVVTVPGPKGTSTVFDMDEEPARANLERFAQLKPAFQKDGTVTAANASSLSDGAAALVLASGETVKTRKLNPLARIVAQASHAQAPEWFTTAPVGAVQSLLKKAGKTAQEIDLFEINEAFSVVALACIKELGLSEDKVNIRGGAVALGHPIGASGARILTTLVHALRAEKKRYGIAAICIGGGEASAVLIEAL